MKGLKIKKNNIYGVIYIVLMIISLIDRFNGVRLSPVKMYICELFLIGLALLNRKNQLKARDIFRRIKWIASMYLLPYLALLIWSYMLLLINESRFSYYTRATANTIYMCIAIIFGICSYMMFAEKAFDLIWISCIICYLINIVMGIARFGFSSLPGYYLDLYSITNNITITAYIEQHELIFIFGLFFLYYLFMSKREDPHRNSKCLVSLAFVFIGMKRILIAALIIIFLVILLFRRFARKNRIKAIKFGIVIIGLSTIIVSYMWVYSIKTGLLGDIGASYGINFMGRLRMYSFFNPYYSFSPLFLGLGVGATEKLMSASGAFVGSSVHSDILRNFLEYGFIGFALWSYYYLIAFPLKVIKKNGRDAATLFFLLMLLSFVLALTDNVFRYHHFQTVIFMIMIKSLMDRNNNSSVLRNVKNG